MVVIRPVQDLDNELELETQLPNFVDMSRLPPDHRIVIDLSELQTDYPLILEKIRKICTRGGTRFYAKNSTFHDPIHLGFVLRFEGSFSDTNVATSFFFLKEDIYVMAICKSVNDQVGSNWLYAMGTKVMIRGSRYVGFGVDYGNLKGCKVGFNEIGHALLKLSLHNDGANFLKIAHHISEGVRNKEVEDTISKSFRIGKNLPIDHLIHHFHSWLAYTKLWCTRFYQLDSQNQKRYLERFRLLGIKNIDHLGNMLQILRMKNQEERMKMRSNALKLYSRGSVSHDSIVKRTTDMARGTAQQLQVHRKAILNELMRSGGDPNIWICIKDALREHDLRYAKLKIQHTNLFLRSRDLSECVDDEGYTYVIVDELMLCEDA